MKIVIAPDSFKGSLTSAEICEIVSRAANDVMSNCDAVSVQIADGGEGTVDSILFSCGGTRVTTKVHDPLGRLIDAAYGIVGAGTSDFAASSECSHDSHLSACDAEAANARSFAVIETAAAAGITLISDDERDIMKLNSYGMGEQIKDAVERGCKEIYIGLGGSATNDGGIGLAAALGAVFYDAEGSKLEPTTENLGLIAKADLTEVSKLLEGIHITLMCDVSNPLLGPEGATAIYGPQKGVKQEMIKPLDEAMSTYADALEAAAGKSIRTNPGAGAAGGLGACLMAIADAEIRSGAQTVLELADFGRKLDGALLAVTGEGKMDGQSIYGKATCAVAEACKAAGVPCVAIVGIAGAGAEAMLEHGITKIIELGRGIPVEESIARAGELCYEAAHTMIEEFYLDYGKFRPDAPTERKHIDVVAAVIRDGDRIFATQRGYGDYKDWWEFPGGKLEPGETPEEALKREIREELNAEIEVGEKLATVEYDYPRFHLTMDCFWCELPASASNGEQSGDASNSEPAGTSDRLELIEAEAAAWLGADELFSVNWLPSDVEIIELIKKELEK